ncbi:hypothetical protein GCM10009759_59790 [Kitasatospora saccharophila]|uniref:Uncharacterized protein n=1 Tax=Kitasatospora saccharophila TaxID=407973 RepID=A0ABN2XP98_9ACTN
MDVRGVRSCPRPGCQRGGQCRRSRRTGGASLWSAGKTGIRARTARRSRNLAGYRTGPAPSGTGNRHTFGGLTDAAFRLVPLLEAGQDAGWPWERDQRGSKKHPEVRPQR